MNKLLSANMLRLLSRKSLWIYTVAIFLITIWYICFGSGMMGIHQPDADAMDYTAFIVGMVPAFLTLFTGFFIGTEYSDKTIRNKISVGHNRKEIFLSYLFTLYAAMGIMLLAWGIGTACAFVFIRAEFDGIGFLNTTFVAAFFSAAFVTLLMLISIMVHSKALAIILQIEFARVSLTVPLMGMLVIDGTANMDGVGNFLISLAVRLLISCCPLGQWMLSTNLFPAESIPMAGQLVLSVLLISGAVLLGIKVFGNKEIK